MVEDEVDKGEEVERECEEEEEEEEEEGQVLVEEEEEVLVGRWRVRRRRVGEHMICIDMPTLCQDCKECVGVCVDVG